MERKSHNRSRDAISRCGLGSIEAAGAVMSLRYAYRLTPWFLGFAVALAAHAMHLESDQARASMPTMQRFTLLPDGETLKAMSLGFKDVMADIIWLQAI